jgi:anti-anti-sigma regulatory factor
MDEKMESNETKVLKLEGRLTIDRVAELKNLLTGARVRERHVTLDLSAAEEADLSFLQLICSTHKDSLKGKKNLILSCDAANPVRTAALQAGFIRTVGCHGDPDKSCLWKGDGEK